MGWRTIVVTQPSKLSLQNDQFKYAPKESETVTVPIDDISVVVIETHQVTITSALLSRLGQENIVVFTCDKTHTPDGIYMPFHQHSRYTQVAHKQIAWSEPFKKRIWQQVISQKVQNQARVLEYMEKHNSASLYAYAKNVKSGDSTNVESSAARIYFVSLFGKKFYRRDEDDWRNSALNYGYAIVRGAIARGLVSHGFLPAFGLFHSSTLNAFNLADDIIEPYRAFVDVVVAEYFEEYIELPYNRFEATHKVELYQILTMSTVIDETSTTLLNSIEICTTSLMNATLQKDVKLIKLPLLENSNG